MLMRCVHTAAKTNDPDRVLKMELMRAQSQVSVAVALAQPMQISGMRKEDPETLENLLMAMLSMLAGAFNVKAGFTSDSMYECVLLVIEKYWYLRPEEVMYVFKRAKMGEYGPVFNKLDIATVMEWLHKYDTEERLNHVEEANRKLVSETKLLSASEVDPAGIYDFEKMFLAEHGISSVQYNAQKKAEAEAEQKRKEMEFREFEAEYYAKKKREAGNESNETD